MDKEELLRLEPALSAFLEEFSDCAAAPTRRLIAAYVRGQLGPLPRKSVRPIAREMGVATRTLQELLSLHKWDSELMLRILRERAARHWGGRPGLGLLRFWGCAKRGDKTPGVARQKSPSSGREENSCVFVQLGLAGGAPPCLLGSELYLPESWMFDSERRRAAGIPDEARYRTPGALALNLVEAVEAAGIRFSWLHGGPELGADSEFLSALSAGGRRFAVEAPEGEIEGGRRVEVPSASAGGASSVVTNAPSDLPPKALEEAVAEARRSGARLWTAARSVGLDHFEVRTYRSLRRHLTLSAASLLFLAEQHARHPDEKDRLFRQGVAL